MASFTVTVSPAGGRQTALSATSVRVGGLHCGQTYTFTVASVGSGGQRVPAAPVSARPCPATAAPAAPTGVNATPAGDSSHTVELSWNAVGGSAGSDLTYLVSWTNFADSGSDQTTGTGLTVDHLRPGHEYTFTVRARNGVGTGPGGSDTAIAGAPGSRNVTVSQDVNILASAGTDADVAWRAHEGDRYIAYCSWDSGDIVWVYVVNEDFTAFGFARVEDLDPDVTHMNRCVSPTV